MEFLSLSRRRSSARNVPSDEERGETDVFAGYSIHSPLLWGTRVAQWWEHSPPTNVARVRILASTPYVGWVCCWFSPLLREVFLLVLRFSPLLKNQHFQIPIRSGTHGHVSTSFYELLSDPWVNKLQFTDYKITKWCYRMINKRILRNRFSVQCRRSKRRLKRFSRCIGSCFIRRRLPANSTVRRRSP